MALATELAGKASSLLSSKPKGPTIRSPPSLHPANDMRHDVTGRDEAHREDEQRCRDGHGERHACAEQLRSRQGDGRHQREGERRGVG